MQANARIFYDKAPARRNKEGLISVKLCVTHKRTRKYYSISDYITKTDWLYISDDTMDKVNSKSPRGFYRDMAFEYKNIVGKAEDIIKNIPQFSFNKFEDVFFNKVTKWDNVFSSFWGHIQDLKAENRHGYASSFESSLRAVKEFHEGKKYQFNLRKDKVETRAKTYLSGKKLTFHDVTPTWLKKFEIWLENSGKSKSTIGIYVRNIRVLFNLVIKEHGVKAEYPFTKHKPKTAGGRKIALSANQISMIAGYKTEHPKEIYFRDMFMFSFLSNGMNLSDIARLRYSNIKGNEIEFVRQKTMNKDNETTLNVPVTRNMQNIIDSHGTKAVGYDAFIFPVLNDEMTNKQMYAAIKQFTKLVNYYIGQIASKIGIKDKVTSYTARHSWATIAKNSGTSIEFIKESLGHSSVLVTERYMKSFEKSTRQEHSEKIENTIYKKDAI